MIFFFMMCVAIFWAVYVRSLLRKKGIKNYPSGSPVQMLLADWSELFCLVRETKDAEAKRALLLMNFFAVCAALALLYQIVFLIRSR